MIEPIDLLSTNFYSLSPYFGSCDKLNFKLEKSEDKFLLTTWKGPFNFETTKEEKSTKTFPFNNDEIKNICDYIIKESQLI
jgi:hypothetical protein